MVKFAEIYVDYFDSMGSDLSVVDVARASFGKASAWVQDDDGHDVLSEKDAGLVKFLARCGHWSPFAHCMASFRIKAPIFVARQLVKHQIGLTWNDLDGPSWDDTAGLSWNEESRRYVKHEVEFFMPAAWRATATNVKQGSSSTEVVTAMASQFSEKGMHPDDAYTMACKTAETVYEAMLGSHVAPELARVVLPVGAMTNWIWTGSLMAFARVCKDRLGPDAQDETSEVARTIAHFMGQLFPVAWAELRNAGEGAAS